MHLLRPAVESDIVPHGPMEVLPGSPALNAANPARPGSGYPACPPRDQRLKPRGATRCDTGAFEVQ